MVTRIGFLFSITLIMRLTAPLFTVFGAEISGRDLILLAGGLFLLGKSTLEIHGNLEGEEEHAAGNKIRKVTFLGVIVQIMLLDVVFSIDSVITAIGLAEHVAVMVAAIIIAVIIMIVLAGPISRVCRGPSDHQDPGVELPAADWLFARGVRRSSCTSRKAISTSPWRFRCSSRC